MNKLFAHFALLIFTVVLIPSIKGQNTEANSIADFTSLQVIQQKPAPKIKGKPAPDVIVEKEDDIHLRFELKNNCSQTIYFLSMTILEKQYPNGFPIGFMVYRREGSDWKARSPAWRREGSLTDPFNYKWKPLKTGKSIEFEYSDLSLIDGERSVAIYINSSSTQEKRIELLAKPFSITRK